MHRPGTSTENSGRQENSRSESLGTLRKMTLAQVSMQAAPIRSMVMYIRSLST